MEDEVEEDEVEEDEVETDEVKVDTEVVVRVVNVHLFKTVKPVVRLTV